MFGRPTTGLRAHPWLPPPAPAGRFANTHALLMSAPASCSLVAGKIKRALKLLFGAAEVSVFEVAGEQWVSPDQLRWATGRRPWLRPLAVLWCRGCWECCAPVSMQPYCTTPPIKPCATFSPIHAPCCSGRAEEELRRAAKGKAKVGEPAPAPPGGPVGLAHDSAWSIHQQQQRQGQYQQPPAGEGQGMEERLRQAAATVLSAGCPSVVQTIDQVYSGLAPCSSSSGAPSPRSRGLSGREQGLELAAVVTHGGHGTEPASYAAGPGPSSSGCCGSSHAGGSAAWDASLGLSSSGAWDYAPGHCSGCGAAAGPSGGSSGAAC